jgi:dolichol-phosphate mannosyltransferase
MLTINPTHLPATASIPDRLVPDLAIVIPTYNEAANVSALVDKLEAALAGRAWEAIFVDDDSPDGTADRVRAIGQTLPQVRCIHRIGRRGLSSAVIEGILSVNATYVAVMDADLQHDETLLPAMLDKLTAGGTDLVVASRYIQGGSIGNWSKLRHVASRIATSLSNAVIHSSLSDPMSGFFMVRRECFVAAVHRLSGNGYKILLDFLASSPQPLRIAELPYRFRSRLAGESKLDARVVFDHGHLLLSKTLGKYVPLRPLLVGAVVCGLVGVHLFLLSYALRWMEFQEAQPLVSLIVAGGSFLLSDRARGRRAAQTWPNRASALGMILLGVLVNLAVAYIVYLHLGSWWLAGGAGAALGLVWNATYRAAVMPRA